MFLREKKVKENSYLYAVENFWKNGLVKQKFRKYLGRVFLLKESRKVSFSAFIENRVKMGPEEYLNYIDYDSLVYDLIKWELYRRGFVIKESYAEKGKLNADFTKRRDILKHNGRPFCIKCNEGYINNLSINQILNAKRKEDLCSDRKEALNFARLFIDGGINVPKEVFTELFAKRFVDIEKEDEVNKKIDY